MFSGVGVGTQQDEGLEILNGLECYTKELGLGPEGATEEFSVGLDKVCFKWICAPV
jgi:hypothetical protein